MLRLLIVTIWLAPLTACAAEPIDFAHDILPLLKTHCAECHTGDARKGELSFNTRETLLKSEVVVPGKSEESELIARVTSTDPDVRMPPKGDPLTAEQISLLRRWIDEGVRWQEGFTFAEPSYVAPLALRRPELPAPRDGREHPLDRLIDAYFQRHDFQPLPLVDDATFLRRVSLDLVGLLPTPEELDAFLADTDPAKRDRVIDRLLDDDRAYAEHWLTFWNDLLRNDYAGTGYIDGGRKPITSWLYPSLLENKPYDQFVRELINPTAEAEGFIKGIKWRGRVNASQTPEIQFAQNVSQVFLGINMKCASCHDSFIDSWKLEDAYGLAAIVSETPLEMHRCDVPTGQFAKAKFLYPELGQLDESLPREQRLARTAELLTSRDNGRFARTIVNRLWQRLMGRGIVHPVDVMSNRPWDVDLLDYLASHLVDHGYDLKQTLRLITSSQAYQSRSVPQTEEASPDEFVFRGPFAKRMTAEQFLDAVWQITDTAPEKPSANFGDRGDEPVRASLVIADRLMRTLGRPNREQVVTTRPDELSTLQALDLTNGQSMTDLLERGAQTVRQQHPDWTADQTIDWLYCSALSRRPSDEERSLAIQVLGEPMSDGGLMDLLWILVMLPEFQLIR